MKSLIVIVFIFSGAIAFAQQKTSKRLTGSQLVPSKVRMAIRFQKETKMLHDLVKLMEQSDFYVVNYKKWSQSYKNNTLDGFITSDSVFIELPKEHKWKGKEIAVRAPYEAIFFKDAHITEVVLKKKIIASLKPDIKIVQLIFENEEKARATIPKMRKISSFTISVDGLKSPNGFWLYKNMIYFCRVRAAAFSIEPFHKVFEEKYGKTTILYWH